MAMPHEARQEIERYLRQGEKIAAIRHLRDKYRFTIDEAKAIVEALEPQTHDSPLHSPADRTSSVPDDTRRSIIALLADGRKLEAVNYAKNELHISLRQAKDLIETIDRKVPSGSRTSKSGFSNKSSLKFPIIIFSIFMFIGLLFCGIAYYLYTKQSSTIERSELVTGKVVEMVRARDNMSAPVLEYEWNGKIWMYRSSTYTNPPAYEVNEEVSIFVNPDNPDEIVIDTFSDRWLAIVIFSVLGGCFVIGPPIFGWLVFRGR